MMCKLGVVPPFILLDSDGELDQRSEDKYLYARTKFKQGHFKCDLKWEKVFCLHPRLKTGKNKLSTRGKQPLNQIAVGCAKYKNS